MKKVAGIVTLLLGLVLCGCIKLEQEITLQRDGSGRVEMMYAMSEQTVEQMKAMAEMARQMSKQEGVEGEEEKAPFEFDQAKVEEGFKAWRDKGIELKSVKSESKGGWHYMHLVFDFKNIATLKETDMFKDNPLTITRDAQGNYVVSSKLSGEGMGPAPGDEEQMKALLPMFKGMRIVMKINTPGAIIETTAPVKTKNSAEWTFDADKDPEAILKMAGTDMKIVFEGKGCQIPEVK